MSLARLLDYLYAVDLTIVEKIVERVAVSYTGVISRKIRPAVRNYGWFLRGATPRTGDKVPCISTGISTVVETPMNRAA